MAPASAVVEGRVFSWRRLRRKSPDAAREPMDQPRQAAPPPTESVIARAHARAKAAQQAARDDDDSDVGGES